MGNSSKALSLGAMNYNESDLTDLISESEYSRVNNTSLMSGKIICKETKLNDIDDITL